MVHLQRRQHLQRTPMSDALRRRSSGVAHRGPLQVGRGAQGGSQMADHAEIFAKRGAIHNRFLTVVSSSPFMCPSPAIAWRGG